VVTRVDIHADKGTEEVLDAAFYALCGGVWIEDEACGVRITCYPADPDRFCAYVADSGVPVRLLTREEEEEKDYVALVRRYFTPVKVGDLTILPPWRKPGKRGRTIVIEPGMAFGTGRHESTRLMIRMMDHVPIEGKSVLDIGSGSGVLAVNAWLLGASSVAALDHDPLAAQAIGKACSLNNTPGILIVAADIAAVRGRFDVVLANLDFATFGRRAAEIIGLAAEGGYLVISGIEGQYAKGVASLFAPLPVLRHHRMGDWHGFVFQKGPA
jgi:ribosomal protein L11 methyltransferase